MCMDVLSFSTGRLTLYIDVGFHALRHNAKCENPTFNFEEPEQYAVALMLTKNTARMAAA